MSAAMMSFCVVTPERTVEERLVRGITLQTPDGELTILPGHQPLVSILKPGMVTVRDESGTSFLASSTGFVEVRADGSVVLLADSAERADELDEQVIARAEAEARRLLSETSREDEEAFAHAAAALERELAREKVARRRHH